MRKRTVRTRMRKRTVPIDVRYRSSSFLTNMGSRAKSHERTRKGKHNCDPGSFFPQCDLTRRSKKMPRARTRPSNMFENHGGFSGYSSICESESPWTPSCLQQFLSLCSRRSTNTYHVFPKIIEEIHTILSHFTVHSIFEIPL